MPSIIFENDESQTPVRSLEEQRCSRGKSGPFQAFLTTIAPRDRGGSECCQLAHELARIAEN
jgi:hypothetical protein